MMWRIQTPAARALGQAFPIVLLLSAVWLVYYPSLGHGPRADQWCFLLDTVGQNDFSSLIAHTYSYNRTRMVAPGDYHLFRPFLFVFLSAEKALFGNNFAWWQATGVLLHCLATYLLLSIILRINVLTREEKANEAAGSWSFSRMIAWAVALALALFFGVNCAVVEMVIWSHINGYILFVVLVLGSLRLLLEGIADQEVSRIKGAWLLGAAWFLTVLSAFTYEIGQFYAVVAGTLTSIALYRKGVARRSAFVFALFFGILILYRLANFVDQRAHAERGPDVEISTILERMVSRSTLTHTRRYMLYDLVQPFFPSLVGWSFDSRLVIPEATGASLKAWRSSPILIASYVLLGGMAGLTLLGVWRLMVARHKSIGLIAALLAFSLIVLHLAITVVGRMNLRPGPDVLSTNSYYPYIPLLFLILGTSAIWAFSSSGPTTVWRRLSNSLGVLLCAALLALSLVSGMKAYAINAKGQKDFAGFTRRISEIERFLREHRAEADFSLAFAFDSCQAIGTQYGVPITTILFQPYLNSSNPKYVVSFPEGEPTVTRYDEWRASGKSSSRLCPELVSVGSSYIYYRADGRYYGVLHWDGCFDSSRRNHAYLIEAATLEEARRQQPGKLAEQDADIREGRFIPPGSSIALVEEGYKGFNLIEAAGKVYAIPQGEGAFDPRKIHAHSYSSTYVGSDIASVKSQIDQKNTRTMPSRDRRGTVFSN